MLFIQKYKRYNFGIEPAAEQIIDVAFEAPSDTSDKALSDLLSKAYEEQAAPLFNNSHFAVEGWSGWSSVMTEGELRRIEDPLDSVGDTEFDVTSKGQTPKIGEIAEFTLDPTLIGRVEGYYKRYTPKYDLDSPHSRIAKNIGEKLRAQRIAENPDAIYDINVVACPREEAQFVSAAGYILPIENVISKGNVRWDRRILLKYRNDYTKSLQHHLKDSNVNITTKAFPTWEAIIEKEIQSAKDEENTQ